MARKPKPIVLDSWAVLAYFEGARAGEKVADIIADAHENGAPLLMAVVNVGEVWHIIARKTSEAEAERSVAELRSLGIQFVDVEWTLARQAAAFKSRHKISYAGCFAVALAKVKNAKLVTGDPELRQAKEVVQIHFLH